METFGIFGGNGGGRPFQYRRGMNRGGGGGGFYAQRGGGNYNQSTMGQRRGGGPGTMMSGGETAPRGFIRYR